MNLKNICVIILSALALSACSKGPSEGTVRKIALAQLEEFSLFMSEKKFNELSNALKQLKIKSCELEGSKHLDEDIYECNLVYKNKATKKERTQMSYFIKSEGKWYSVGRIIK